MTLVATIDTLTQLHRNLSAGDAKVAAGIAANGFRSVVTPEMFAAVGDGAADDGPALAACFNFAISNRADVQLGARVYVTKQPLPVITAPIRIWGAGQYKTWIKFHRDASGTCLSTQNVWWGASSPAWSANSETVDPSGEKSGVSLVGFTIVGDRTTSNTQAGIVHFDRTDNLFIDDVSVHNIKGLGWGIGLEHSTTNAFLRESVIGCVQVRRCGDQHTNTPAFLFQTTGSGTQDASNEIIMNSLKIVWSDGQGALFRNTNSKNYGRYIWIKNLMVHGREETIENPQREDSVSFIGGFASVEIEGLEINGIRDNQWGMTFDKDPDSGFAPRNMRISGSVGSGSGEGNGIWFKNIGPGMSFSVRQLRVTGISVKADRTVSVPVYLDDYGDARHWEVDFPDQKVATNIRIGGSQNIGAMAVENLPSASKYRNNILRTDNGFQSVDKPSGVNGLVISDGTIWRGLPLSRTDVSKSTPYDPEGMMKFEAVWFPPIEAPNSPDTGVVMYCDAADGKLKVKTSGGSITHLVEETLIDLS